MVQIIMIAALLVALVEQVVPHIQVLTMTQILVHTKLLLIHMIQHQVLIIQVVLQRLQVQAIPVLEATRAARLIAMVAIPAQHTVALHHIQEEVTQVVTLDIVVVVLQVLALTLVALTRAVAIVVAALLLVLLVLLAVHQAEEEIAVGGAAHQQVPLSMMY